MRTFALAGNPNSGKTTLFNGLTGSTAHVGNWPGVTVDKREGIYKGGEEKANIVDLPGIYSLSPYTPEEVIARNYILDEKPDGIINIVDATNLERNLYLTTQLLEMDVPVIIALNMMDEVEKSGDTIDVKALEAKIGAPVVSICALKNKGLKELMQRAVEMPAQRKGATVVSGTSLDGAIAKAEQYYAAKEDSSSPVFHAMKLLEKDELEMADKANAALQAEIETDFGEDLEAVIADERYKYISANFSSAKKKGEKKEALTKSDKIDKVLTHKIWSIPIFIVILFVIFHLTFSENLLYLNGFTDSMAWMPTLDELGIEGGLATFVGIFYDGAVFSPGVILFNIMDVITASIGDGLAALMETAPVWASGLVVDAVWGGIAAVLSFVPQILVLFAFFSVLEDSGYMARVAFILDRIFRRFGLSGRAFMPMIMGFGCSVPAMINTRTLADDKERTATIRVIPFFSCGAKLPILTAVAGTLCGGAYLNVGIGAEAVTFFMYLTGIVVAIIAVIVMRNTTMRGATPPFIMELPAYHAPQFKGLCIHVWDKLKHYVKKAFTIIFISTVIIWFLSSFTWQWSFTEDISESILGSVGMLIQPIFTPLGFGSQLGTTAGWVFAVAAITGLIAKENVIATFGALAAAITIGGEAIETEEGIEEVWAMITAIKADTDISDLQITAGMIAFIVFNMTTIPCFAACATAKAELPEGKFKWTVCFWLVTSYLAACIVYTSIAWAWCIPIWLVIAAGIGTLIYFNNKGKLEGAKFWRKLKKKS